jgi:hypothetical protein
MNRTSKIAFEKVNVMDRVADVSGDPQTTRVPAGTLITIEQVGVQRIVDFNRRMNRRRFA